MHLVRLLLNVAEVLCLFALVLEAGFMRVEHNVIGLGRNLIRQIDGLRDITDALHWFSFSQSSCQFKSRFFPHAIGNHVSIAVTKDAGT